MPTREDLVGLGMPPVLASTLGNSPNALTCLGTSQATAAPILSHLSTLTTGASATGAILPAGALIGTPYYVFNSTSTTGIVYAPVSTTALSTTMNGGASTTGVNVAQNKLCSFIQVSRGVWASNLTA